MPINRVDRLNSLLKEVISDIIRRRVKNPVVSELITVTQVKITKDLHHAKVYISIIGDEKVKAETMDALDKAKGFIAVQASKEVVMRFFPSLTFILDDSVEKHMRIENILNQIHEDERKRGSKE
ncbi:30S ribosome-binding factor RbfA [Estrella lausannensis]|uniref:Ribosome-binding factor A n=1 Tax=Estrella lausannensis TaxID=483423 RepID=A0A0H5DRR5_9BACT|nr:30S ribosome-binding factor RbfA [Estrella lausannensis]CRX39302.1 Ribosome-binding factor A [Estrella lausannensis]